MMRIILLRPRGFVEQYLKKKKRTWRLRQGGAGTKMLFTTFHRHPVRLFQAIGLFRSVRS